MLPVGQCRAMRPAGPYTFDAPAPTALRRASVPFLRPEMPYETDGFFPNVVFSNGLVTWEDDRVFIYYGACDESTCLLQTTVSELLTSLD